MIAMLLYRGVGSIPATLRDFTSSAARGRRLPGEQTPERLDRWAGLSTYDTEEALRKNLALFPKNGPYVAVLDVPDTGSIRVEKHQENIIGQSGESHAGYSGS
jgi:hypothetical protein